MSRRLGIPSTYRNLWTPSRAEAGHGTAPAGGVAGAVARTDSGGDEPDPFRDVSNAHGAVGPFPAGSKGNLGTKKILNAG